MTGMIEPSRILKNGTAVGPYIVVEPIGSGGMGDVYRAQDPRLGRQVAIKVLAPAADEELIARFEREARATALLSHPNIVTIFDVGVHGGCPFLVSELLEGQTLRKRLGAGALEPQPAVELAVQLARGLAAAHALKIIHRDLKPENLFITRQGILKVLDFGLAKLKPEPNLNTEDLTVAISQPGMLLGTPAYMAPEQLRGEPVDERTDIFALGMVLYEMVSGCNPFQKKSAAETLAAILGDEPPPIDAAKRIPGALLRVIHHCLKKDPEERFQVSRDLAFALESLLGELHHPVAQRPAVSQTQVSGSIAVLPFADMSATRDQGWLCEGLAEELINALTHIDGLRVAARSSSFQFPASGVDVRAVGARLGVATVLEGGVRKLGERLRVTVQLVDVADGYQRWSQRFDRTLADVFDIQDEIAQSVATALRGILTPREKEALRRPETVMEGYEYFLRGRQLIRSFARTALEKARRMFERAIEIDPNYAPAYAGLADVHCWVYEWYGGDAADFEAAHRASERALDLAPDLSEAHSSRGFVLSLAGRYQEAELEFQAAIALNPNSFDAHYLYARSCFAWGRIDQSAEQFRRASECRQEDFQSLMLLAQSLRKLGRDEEALEASREGIRRAERHLELDPTDARALSMGANGLMDVGQVEKALHWSHRAVDLHPDDQGVLINSACVHIRAGLKEEALNLLEQTFSRGWGKRDWIEHDPDYDILREDPRFQAMLEKLP
ncbi:MAG: protein kinase [Acidobacteriota bacterium]